MIPSAIMQKEEEPGRNPKTARKENAFLKLLIYGIALTLTVSQALTYLQRYRDVPTKITYRVEEREEFVAPKITVCRFPAWNVAEPPPDWQNETVSSFFRKYSSLAFHFYTRGKVNGKFCLTPEKVDLVNISSVVDRPCGTWTQTFQYHKGDLLDLRRCFTLHPKTQLGIQHSESGFYFVLAPDGSKTTAARGTKAPWEISIHNDPDWASDLEGTSTAFKVHHATANTIHLSAREMLYKSTPARPCEADPSYSRDRCRSDCAARALSTDATCRLNWMNLSLPLCERMKDLRDLIVGYDEKTRRNGDSNCSCPPPCRRVRYTVAVAPKEFRCESGPSLMTVLKIYFPRRQVEVLVEKEAYDSTQMVGELGGCVGLFLGFSLVSVYEIVAGFFSRREGKNPLSAE
ncbi:unnamed protein product [Darwinula stevensoni]|uniref:Uncharacterized protein n=1 Tax=Darwinula stevensoni TaxID=69355 RepID=A0A7R9A7T7_9CRUS|nr:unnamed protein product [Darwinula stevensoni]CAG0894958.1 unnamed protein product [Darwinula stevensoni]